MFNNKLYKILQGIGDHTGIKFLNNGGVYLEGADIAPTQANIKHLQNRVADLEEHLKLLYKELGYRYRITKGIEREGK